ncbi:MAG: YraN family protein [Lawsonibacter sp.]|nr:YraN family protein [Lawsonibacter sp.]
MSGGDRQLLGRWGEAAVAEFLRGRGFVLEAAGWRCRFGELDLVAGDGRFLAFVEVKLRRDSRFAQAREFVDGRKQHRLRLAAQLYLAQHPTALQPRFDVAEVYAPQGTATKNPEIRYWENAFW